MVGGLELALGLTLALAGSGSEAALGVGVTYAALGLFQLVYGVVASAMGASSPAAEEAASVRTALAPTRGGASLLLAVTF